MTIGIEKIGNRVEQLMKAGVKIPCEVEKMFKTTTDN